MAGGIRWRALQSAIAGEVILPDSPDFELAGRSLNARFDHVMPEAVVSCEGPEDVAKTIRFARAHRLEVGVRGGGHCFAGRSSTRGLLIDVTPMSSVTLSGEVAVVGGGTRLGRVYDELLRNGRTIPGGSCPTVGIGGLTLGGGLGIIGRAHGLTSDRLLGATVVLADGRIVDCDAHHDEDLFWALRGAGAGNFGVVTALSFQTVPAPDATNFHLAWPFQEAATLIEAWQTWAPSAPDELAASLLIGAGPRPDEPPSVEVFGVMLGSESDAADLMEALAGSTGRDPESSFSRHMSFGETVEYWADRAARDPVEGEPPGQELRGHRFIKSEYFGRPLPADVIRALLAVLTSDRVAGQSRELDFSPWGGAYGRVAADATAFVHRDDLFWLKHAAEVEPGSRDDAKEAAHRWATRSWGTVHPLGTGRVFPNFPDPDLEDWPRAYFGSNLERLRTVKARYDPENLFRFRQSLPAG